MRGGELIMRERCTICISMFAFIFLSIQLLSSSKAINNFRYITKNSALLKDDYRIQRICILAGPHKTGTSSVQTNLWRWSPPTFHFNGSQVLPLEKPVIDWIWPVPARIAQIEHNDTHSWDWTPSKAFYPMMEALVDPQRKYPKRTLFQELSASEIIQSYSDTIARYWDEGKNIVFGTEAMDMIIKLPEGPRMTRNISQNILPESVDPSQVTVVVMYRTPKISHLVSMWHQNCNRDIDPKFFEWITTTKNTLGPIDSLGMISLFLEQTNWSIAVVDLAGLKKEGWDSSHFVACEILGEKCDGKVVNGLESSDAMTVNVRSNKRPPNVPNITLEKMDAVLMDFDCNYISLIENPDARLKVYYPSGLEKIMDRCKREVLTSDGYPKTRDKMRQTLTTIALEHGKLE